MRWRKTPALAAAVLILMPVGSADAATRSVSIKNFVFSPAATTAVLNDSVRWTNNDFSAHDTTSEFPTPVGWASPTLPRGASFSTVLTAAGGYDYLCTIHPTMTGSVKVPVVVSPVSGGTTTRFTIRVATVAAPAGFEYVIQRKAPGASGFAPFRTTTAATVKFVPDEGVGTYSFRSFVRQISTGERTATSPARSITVT